MIEPFIEGRNRVVYKSEGFKTDLTVTVKFWDPFLETTPLIQFTELGEGLYYLDFNFNHEGTWIGLLYENGVKKGTQTYKVTKFIDNRGVIIHKTKKGNI